MPETLASAGFEVVVPSGAGPDDYSVYELERVSNIDDLDSPTRPPPDFKAFVGYWNATQVFLKHALDSTGAVTRRKGCAPEKADLVYAHLPATELPAIIATAAAIHAEAVWTQSGFSALGSRDPSGCWIPDEEYQRAAELVRSAGISYVNQPYITDAVREVYALKI